MSVGICKYCGCETTVEMLKAKKRQKMERVSKSLLDRQASGLPIGRPKTRDEQAIVKLRKQGMSFREIAKILDCSVGSVQAAIKLFEGAAPASQDGPVMAEVDNK